MSFCCSYAVRNTVGVGKGRGDNAAHDTGSQTAVRSSIDMIGPLSPQTWAVSCYESCHVSSSR